MPRGNSTSPESLGWTQVEAEEVKAIRTILRRAMPKDHNKEAAIVAVLQFALAFVIGHSEQPEDAVMPITYMTQCYMHDRWPTLIEEPCVDCLEPISRCSCEPPTDPRGECKRETDGE